MRGFQTISNPSMNVSALNKEEYDPYFERYIELVPETTDLRSQFEIGMLETIQFFKFIPESKHGFKYVPGKWTIPEVLQHLIDAERIFMYRIFRIARNDKTGLANFDHNIYIEPSRASKKSMTNLIDEYQAIRKASISLLNSLSDLDLCRIRVSCKVPMSARAAAFTIIGHEIWHCDIIQGRYLDMSPS